MRIAVIHNQYQEPGGEDTVFQQESELLSKKETILKITRHNKRGLPGFFQFLLYPYNLFAAYSILKELERFKPDIVHFHNLHYAIGPLIIRMLHKRRIPMCMTLHNYRLLCPSATLFQKDRIFLDSLYQDFPWKAVRLGVYSQSPIKTFWLALTYYLHKKAGTWNMIDRHFVLSKFAQELFIKHYPAVYPSKFAVKPNFVPDPLQSTIDKPLERQEHFLFIGRLAPEKGILFLLSTFAGNGKHLKIAGDGPLRKEVENATKKHPNIVYLGSLDKKQVQKELQSCTALIFPSIWYEGMPMTLIEAFANGTPVISSRLGAMQSMVIPDVNGYLFDTEDMAQLDACLQKWSVLEDEQKELTRQRTRQHYLHFYRPEANKYIIMDYYEDILS